MPRRPRPRSRRPARAPTATIGRRPVPRRGLVAAGAAIAVAAGFGLWWSLAPSSATLLARAEAAERAGDRPGALAAWRRVNATEAARARTWLAEAKAALAIDLAGQAEAALKRANQADPAEPEPWRLRLDLLRAEGRSVEAARVGWEAYGAVPLGARRGVLRELTLALLLLDAVDDLPDDRARARVDRWSLADPDDADALVARHRRSAAQPRPGEASGPDWIATLSARLARAPGSVAAREALVVARLDAGEPDQARVALDAWPAADRDARFDRLSARLSLDFDARPDLAAASLARVLAELPHDWRSHAGLARASRALGRPLDAAREAATVDLLRERLDPATLVPRLAEALSRPDSPASRRDLADLCDRVGLARLASAWRAQGR